MDYLREGRRLHEWRCYLWGWLVAEGVEALAIETPLQSNKQRPVAGAEDGRTEAATSMLTVYRIYQNVAAAFEIAGRLNIKAYPISVGAWRNSFLGVSRAPKTLKASQRRAWWKAQVRTELDRLGIKTRNNDQGDAAAMCWFFRGLLRLEGIGARPGELLERAIA